MIIIIIISNKKTQDTTLSQFSWSFIFLFSIFFFQNLAGLQYHGMVRYHASTQARSLVRDSLSRQATTQASDRTDRQASEQPLDLEAPLQSVALRWALRAGANDVVLGLSQPLHVQHALSIAGLVK